MTHGRPTRKPRRISRNPIALAKNNATLLTPAEIAKVIDPLRAAVQALRQGTADEDQWAIAASAINVAKAIEAQRVVRGLAEHLQRADLALQAIKQRATAHGEWKPTALYHQELDAITTAVDLHAYQVRQLSYREFSQAVRRAASEIRSTGGRVIEIKQTEGERAEQ